MQVFEDFFYHTMKVSYDNKDTEVRLYLCVFG